MKVYGQQSAEFAVPFLDNFTNTEDASYLELYFAALASARFLVTFDRAKVTKGHRTGASLVQREVGPKDPEGLWCFNPSFSTSLVRFGKCAFCCYFRPSESNQSSPGVPEAPPVPQARVHRVVVQSDGSADAATVRSITSMRSRVAHRGAVPAAISREDFVCAAPCAASMKKRPMTAACAASSSGRLKCGTISGGRVLF